MASIFVDLVGLSLLLPERAIDRNGIVDWLANHPSERSLENLALMSDHLSRTGNLCAISEDYTMLKTKSIACNEVSLDNIDWSRALLLIVRITVACFAWLTMWDVALVGKKDGESTWRIALAVAILTIAC